MSNISEHQFIDAKDIPILKNAPIREAVIQINFSTEGNFNPEEILKLKGKLPGEFSDFRPVSQSAIHFKIDPQDSGSQAHSNNKLIGYRVESQDENKVIILQTNKVIVSLLPPYSHWGEFKEYAKNIWDIYRKILPNIELERAALRYVNELNIPSDESGNFNFEEYLRYPPNYPIELGENIEFFFTRIVIPYNDAKATIIQTIENVQKNSINLILDSDVFRTGLKRFSEKELWDTFDRLRIIKDTIFFNSLTNEAIEKYK